MKNKKIPSLFLFDIDTVWPNCIRFGFVQNGMLGSYKES